MRENVKVFQLDDRYTKLTVISTFRHPRLVEHELLARGRDHEDYRKKHLRGALEKIQTAQLFHSSFSRSKSKSGSSAAVAGVPGIGKTTMLQKIVYDWATGKIFQQFQFVFSFKFRDLNTINCRINLRELILDQYPYFGNILREVWKNPEGLLFIFDGLDEFKHRIDFADSRRDTEPKHQCPDPEWWCEVSDIVYSLIQGKLLPGCSVLVTTRPTVLHFLEKAKIGVWAEILGFFNDLGDSGVKLVSMALGNPECKIQKLWLRDVGLTDSGAEDLASALSTNPSLTELDLSNNTLGDSGVKLVFSALGNPELNRVGLTDSGAENLASSLSTNPTLTELDLSNNKLGDSGVKLVSAALRNPECKIQKLRLNNVGLTVSGTEDLASALSTNPSLTGLDLGLNSLTDRSVPALRRLILTCPNLNWIELDGNRFSQTGEKDLRSLREVRRGLTVIV
ncbi:NACHT, LRR and PYD domains-containing protein 14-like [Hemitrygon akajei]|uniref:NACHT, LRR and PYD domains-containing protein 14-like n=1 Tax=Hemitrygon akajei TaxID=2704970 RepID=UPI003BF9D987